MRLTRLEMNKKIPFYPLLSKIPQNETPCCPKHVLLLMRAEWNKNKHLWPVYCLYTFSYVTATVIWSLSSPWRRKLRHREVGVFFHDFKEARMKVEK